MARVILAHLNDNFFLMKKSITMLNIVLFQLGNRDSTLNMRRISKIVESFTFFVSGFSHKFLHNADIYFVK